MGNKIKENYKSWHVDLNDASTFSDNKSLLEHILRFAILAPSGHNTQPWLFKISDDCIEVYKNNNKRLKIGDPEDRLMLISIGCAITNIKIAAEYYGFTSKVEYLLDENVVAKVFLEKSLLKNRNTDHLINSIPKRSTNRTKYLEKGVPESFFSEVLEFKKSISDKIHLNWFSDTHSKNIIGELSAGSASEVMDKEGFLKELSRHIKNNLTSSKWGIPAFGMSIPTIPSFVAPFLVRYFNMDKVNHKSNIMLFKKYTPTVGVITVSFDDELSWVLTGELYEIIALVSEKYGMKTSVWGAPVVARSWAFQIKEKLNLVNEVEFVFRLGFPSSEQPHSPRYALDDVLIKN